MAESIGGGGGGCVMAQSDESFNPSMPPGPDADGPRSCVSKACDAPIRRKCRQCLHGRVH